MRLLLLVIAILVCGSSLAQADPYGDAVASYAPVIIGGEPIPEFRDPTNALGAPDCADPITCTVIVALGRGGTLTLELTTNFLTGNGDASPDLVIYEVGVPEALFVEVSADGVSFQSVGMAEGGTSSIDIDAFGFGPGDQLFFVRLTDAEAGLPTGPAVGADIDAIEVLSMIPPVPTLGEYGTTLLVVALLAAAIRSIRRLSTAAAP